MNNLNTILKTILSKKSIFLIGKTNSGKTHFVKNKLIPFLKENKLKVKYFKDCDNIILTKNIDTFIVDEVELLFDKDFLEKKYSKEKPYYSKKYLEKVKNWFVILKKIKKPSIYIITRNEDDEISNLINNMKLCEWDMNLNIQTIKTNTTQNHSN